MTFRLKCAHASRGVKALLERVFAQEPTEVIAIRTSDAERGKHLATVVNCFPDFVNELPHPGSVFPHLTADSSLAPQ